MYDCRHEKELLLWKKEAEKNKKKACLSLWNTGGREKLPKWKVVILENVGIKNQQWMWLFLCKCTRFSPLLLQRQC